MTCRQLVAVLAAFAVLAGAAFVNNARPRTVDVPEVVLEEPEIVTTTSTTTVPGTGDAPTREDGELGSDVSKAPPSTVPTTSPVPATQPPAPAPVVSGYPRGCTIPGTFDPGPCIPRTTCVLPQFICNREAGSINVWNYGGSGASGSYQFMPGTWAGYGGYQYAADAPEWVQDARALEVWAGGRGCSHWSACS